MYIAHLDCLSPNKEYIAGRSPKCLRPGTRLQVERCRNGISPSNTRTRRVKWCGIRLRLPTNNLRKPHPPYTNNPGQFDNTWIETDYICSSYLPKTAGCKHSEIIRCSDQRRHPVFVRIQHGELCEIFTEVEVLGEVKCRIDS